MSIKHIEEYRDPEIAQRIADNIRRISRRPLRLMEVCGTHTMSIFRSGIRAMLPENITLLSGPGCPVCVTSQGEINAFIRIARQEEVILTTFGDLMRVPGTDSSLQKERASARDIRVVYSVSDALKIAGENRDKKIVFPGVGFETTAPTIAVSMLSARQMSLDNFLLFSAHKRVPPALDALMATNHVRIDGFILPGHVSVIIGIKAYEPFFERYQVPSVVAGFEPVDILQAIFELVDQAENGQPALKNTYQRAVASEGNLKAQKIMEDVFETTDVVWRGIGMIPQSGLKIRKEYAAFDAEEILDIKVSEVEEPRGCACGDILRGIKSPPECPLFRKVCTPIDPVGPCMVSSEGTCGAYYRYHREA